MHQAHGTSGLCSCCALRLGHPSAAGTRSPLQFWAPTCPYRGASLDPGLLAFWPNQPLLPRGKHSMRLGCIPLWSHPHPAARLRPPPSRWLCGKGPVPVQWMKSFHFITLIEEHLFGICGGPLFLSGLGLHPTREPPSLPGQRPGLGRCPPATQPVGKHTRPPPPSPSIPNPNKGLLLMSRGGAGGGQGKGG